MKKTIIALLALAGVASAAAPTWSTTMPDDDHITYTTTQTGRFTFDSLGDAGIKDGESFSMTLTFTCPSNPFNQGNAISFIAAKGGSTSDLYDISGGNNQFRLYVRASDSTTHFNVNGWSYGGGNEVSTTIPNYTWTVPATNAISAENPAKIGITFTFVNSADAPDGDDYFTIASTADSQIQFDTFTERNIVRSYNFNDLTNETGYIGAPTDMVTTISITKAVPEPTTATLSLLALAGLAARRRRK